MEEAEYLNHMSNVLRKLCEELHLPHELIIPEMKNPLTAKPGDSSDADPYQEPT